MSEFPLSSARPRAKPRSTRIWLILAILIVAVWVFAGSIADAAPPDIADDLEGSARFASLAGYIVGETVARVLFSAGLVWLVLYLGFTRRLARQRGWAHFIVLVITAAIAVAPVTAIKFIGLTGGVQSSGAVAKIVEEGQARAAADAKAERAENARILAGEPFSGRALARPGGVAAARAKLTELRQSAANSLAASQANADSMRAKLVALPMSEDRRAELLSEHDRGFAAGRADGREGVEATTELLDAVEGQLDVLSRTPRGWIVEGGEFAFTSDRDMRDFNAHVREFQAAQARVIAAQHEKEARDRASSPRP